MIVVYSIPCSGYVLHMWEKCSGAQTVVHFTFLLAVVLGWLCLEDLELFMISTRLVTTSTQRKKMSQYWQCWLNAKRSLEVQRHESYNNNAEQSVNFRHFYQVTMSFPKLDLSLYVCVCVTVCIHASLIMSRHAYAHMFLYFHVYILVCAHVCMHVCAV